LNVRQTTCRVLFYLNKQNVPLAHSVIKAD
jgi:hypothetical protein